MNQQPQGGGPVALSAPAKPDILLLMPDQMRGDCLSALGHPAVRTPTLDALAADIDAGGGALGLFTATHTYPAGDGVDAIATLFHPGAIATLPVSASRNPLAAAWVVAAAKTFRRASSTASTRCSSSCG